MHPLAETLLDEPVIAAVKTDEALTAALASPCSTIFLLASTLLCGLRRWPKRWKMPYRRGQNYHGQAAHALL